MLGLFLCKDTQKTKVFKKKTLSLQQISKNGAVFRRKSIKTIIRADEQ